MGQLDRPGVLTFAGTEAALDDEKSVDPSVRTVAALRAVVRFARTEFDATDLDLASLLDEAINAENADSGAGL